VRYTAKKIEKYTKSGSKNNEWNQKKIKARQAGCAFNTVVK